MPKILSYKVIVEQDEDGVFVASVPDIPGCHSQGDTYEEVIENIDEVIKLCLEVANKNSGYKSKINYPYHGNLTRFLGITVILKSEPEGGYTAIVPSLPGCVTYGETVEEAQKMVKDAIEGYLVSLKKHNEKVPEEQNVYLTSVFANA